MNDLIRQDIGDLESQLYEQLDAVLIELTKELELADAELTYGTTS